MNTKDVLPIKRVKTFRITNNYVFIKYRKKAADLSRIWPAGK